LGQCVFNKGPKQLQELKRACDKVYETQEHAMLVQEAFTKGQRPPLMLSLEEKSQIKVMLKKVESRKLNKNKH
tara:strand:- start:198 stop:416 length:219 start_codon:yes stop_codon:yes gene_type:complete